MDRAIQTYKPLISKRILLLVTGLIWLVSGCLLVNRACECIFYNSHHILFHLLVGFALGALSFFLIFFRISKKYTNSVLKLDQSKPILFSYANIRIYIFLAVITVIVFYLKRHSSINPIDLSIGYIALGFAIIFSSIKFFFSVISFRKLVV